MLEFILVAGVYFNASQITYMYPMKGMRCYVGTSNHGKVVNTSCGTVIEEIQKLKPVPVMTPLQQADLMERAGECDE